MSVVFRLVAATLLLFMAGTAQATTLTFGQNNGPFVLDRGAEVQEHGYSVQNIDGFLSWINGDIYDADPTSSVGLVTNFGQTTTTITRIDGGPFNLYSIDFSDAYNGATIAGFIDYSFETFGLGGAGGGGSFLVDDLPGLETVLFSLVNLSSFSFTADSDLRYVQFDNVQVTATPIPAAFPLLGTALAGLGFMQWRRKRQTARVAA
jgi:hypothetical protein